MSLKDLDLILKKDPVITTFPASSLHMQPQRVEVDYRTHALTHLPLGGMENHVDTIFRWVSGANKGAFIGAVAGDHGEGKTSFLVHTWAESAARRIFAVPPFEWRSVQEIASALGAWMDYILGKERPDLARRARDSAEDFRHKSLEEHAAAIAKERRLDYDAVLETLLASTASGGFRQEELSAARLLDFVAEASGIVQEAGYHGLLLLLDEPEVAAKALSAETVAQFLFDLTNEIRQREGSYGVFLSMPETFLADLSRRFAALPARLQTRNCFPRLGDLYGSDFAQKVWTRYTEAFGIADRANDIVTPDALEAIGQVGSSERKDLSYGPRTVISAFRCMVDHYQRTGLPYQPEDFVASCLNDEIMFPPTASGYPSKLRHLLSAPGVTPETESAVRYLAAFPGGLLRSQAGELGIEATLDKLVGPNGLVYRTSLTYGLTALRKPGIGPDLRNELQESVQQIDSEFAPSPRAFQAALDGFARFLVPEIFAARKGGQLQGWDQLSPMLKFRSGARLGTKVGAFPQTEHHCPQRATIVVVSAIDDDLESLGVPELPDTAGTRRYDLFIHFALRWKSTQALAEQRVEINDGDVVKGKPARIRFNLDLDARPIEQDVLAEWVGGDERLTPLWALYLLEQMATVQLPKEHEPEWKALQQSVIRELLAALFDEQVVRGARQSLDSPVSEGALGLVGDVAARILARRYPEYVTLMRQPQWQRKVDDYINAISSTTVPLAAKRGRTKWAPDDDDQAARVLGTNRMNLANAYTGYESLITITAKSRAPLQVAFRLHPLEQEIADLLLQQPMGPQRKFKVDGRECRYMPLEEVLPYIEGKGYSVEELRKIVIIGKNRGSFEIGSRHGEQVLYRRPIDPEEMKGQLRAKLVDLQAEIEAFGALPGFSSSFDAVDAAAAIDALHDDADFEALQTRLNKEFEGLHARLGPYFDRLRDDLIKQKNSVKALMDSMTNARELNSIRALPQGTSRWCEPLGRCVLGNLKHNVSELRQGAESLNKELEQALARYTLGGRSEATRNLEVVTEGCARLPEQEQQVARLTDRWGELRKHLQDYESWLTLVRSSDQLLAQLQELQKDAAHEQKAREIFAAYDDLSKEVCNHLEVRNLQALSSHRQYMARLEELEKRRMDYIRGLKDEFDRRKEIVNRLLDALNPGTRVKAVFLPTEVGASYTRLYEEGVELVRSSAIAQRMSEMQAIDSDLKYTRDILRSADPVRTQEVLAGIDAARQALDALDRVLAPGWLQAAAEESTSTSLGKVKATLDESFAAVRQGQQLLRESVKPEMPEDAIAKQLYGLVPERESVDLKALVLGIRADEADPSRALEASLLGLAELFRHHCVQISIQRRRL